MKVAMIGVGRMGWLHARNLGQHPRVSELRVFDADAARASDIARQVQGRAVPSLDAALNGADAAVIATPTGTHPATIGRCLDAGLPTFCEKPISIGLTETRAVVDRVASTGALLQVGFQRRFDPGYQAARQCVLNGSLGTIYSFTMISRDRLPPTEAYIATSGGLFRDLHIHDFDALRWLLGQEVDEVYVAGSVRGLESYSTYHDAATSAITVQLRNGTVGTFNGARHNPAGYDIRVDLFGSQDSLSVGLDHRTPTRSVEPDPLTLTGPAYPGFYERFDAAYRAEIDAFLRLASGEGENACPPTEALEALRIAEAAHRSYREHRPVTLAEIA